MSQQSRSWQQKYLDSLKDTNGLYWYCESVLPPSMRKTKLHDGWSPVGYPGKNIPVVPVGKDWKASRRIADMLCWIFRVHVPYALEIAPVVAAECDMNAYGAPWRIWTDDVLLDVVCACCGSIDKVSYMVAEESVKGADGQPNTRWLCAECVDSQRWHKAYWEAIV